jgi:hypothetical protein
MSNEDAYVPKPVLATSNISQKAELLLVANIDNSF